MNKIKCVVLFSDPHKKERYSEVECFEKYTYEDIARSLWSNIIREEVKDQLAPISEKNNLHRWENQISNLY